MNKGEREPIDWEEFEKTATVIEIQQVTLGVARDRAGIKPLGRIRGNGSGRARPVGAGKPQGKLS